MYDLYRVINGKKDFLRMKNKLTELEAIATKVTPVLSDMPKGGSPNPKDDAWAKFVDYKEKVQGQMERYLQDCIDLETELEAIVNGDVRVCLKYRYIDDLSIGEIATKTGYSSRNVDRLLSKGRLMYEKFYNCK